MRIPGTPVLTPSDSRSFDCVVVRFASDNFAQETGRLAYFPQFLTGGCPISRIFCEKWGFSYPEAGPNGEFLNERRDTFAFRIVQWLVVPTLRLRSGQYLHSAG